MEYVTVTVAPKQRLVVSVNGEQFTYTEGNQVQVLAVDAINLKRDGVIV